MTRILFTNVGKVGNYVSRNLSSTRNMGVTFFRTFGTFELPIGYADHNKFRNF